jgi:hypothetical protein
VYDFVNGCNHGYKFCVIFCSRMRLNLSGMVLPTQGICTLGYTKIHKVAEHNFQHRFTVNVWCGVSGSNLTGSHVTEGLLTAPYYRTFLENELPLHLEDVPPATRRRMWLRHDGASPHFGKATTEFLNEDHEGTWIGRNGPVAWSAPSPDLTPLDFFVGLHDVECISRW